MRALIVALGLAACGRDNASAPSCDQVVDHLLDVTKQQLAGHGSAELGRRDDMIAQCKELDLPAGKRACLVGAKTLTELAACKVGALNGSPRRHRD